MAHGGEGDRTRLMTFRVDPKPLLFRSFFFVIFPLIPSQSSTQAERPGDLTNGCFFWWDGAFIKILIDLSIFFPFASNIPHSCNEQEEKLISTSISSNSLLFPLNNHTLEVPNMSQKNPFSSIQMIPGGRTQNYSAWIEGWTMFWWPAITSSTQITFS